MDVFFETQIGSKFSIEIGYFDTILEIKQRIQKYHHIHVSKQILSFNGDVLEDHLGIEQLGIHKGSCLQIYISSSPSNSTEPISNGQTTVMVWSKSNNNPKKRRVLVLPYRETRKIPVEVNADDNVAELRKELIKIQEMFQFNLPEEGYFFIHKQNVMDEDQSFRWNHVYDGDTIDIFKGRVERQRVELLPPKSGTGKNPVDSTVLAGLNHKITKSDNSTVLAGTNLNNNNNPKKLRVLVVPKSGTRMVAVEMNADDNVRELRKELIKFPDRLNLPKEGYFFIHKRNVMQEDQSFRWHHVDNLGTIIFLSRKISVILLGPFGLKIVVEMNADDNVGELRKELLYFPLEGYFFMHKEKVMDEDRSFWSHNVDDGDTVQIIPVVSG